MPDQNAGNLTPWQTFGMGTAGAGMLGGGLYGMMNPGKNPAASAMPYLNQIPDTIKPYYEPYINAGRTALPILQNQFGQMLNDPGAIYNKLGAGYTQSPGYQFRLNQGENAINNAMASRGMLGTPEHGYKAGELAENLAGADFDKYLGRLLGIYQGGLTGMSGLNEQGFGASGDLATSLANLLQGKANYEFTGQAGLNQAKSQNEHNLFGGLGAIGSLLGMTTGIPGLGAIGSLFGGGE